MRFLAVALLLALAGQALAQEDLNVGDAAPSRMLNNYLKAEVQKHFDKRKQVVAELKTPEDIKRRQEEMRKFFLEAIGGLPEKRGPLNPQIKGKIEEKDYVIEKVIYESRPNHHVTGNLYLPKGGKPPFPGVLVPCGHGPAGKAYVSYQRMCILLAKNGFVALCYDPIGQGERNQILDNEGKPKTMNTLEHTQLGIGALLVGQNTATYRIWDGMRSLDYLASRPEVDPQKLGCMGHSGGGTMTSYLMALDDRIKAACPSCYITSLEALFAERGEAKGPQDAEQNITGQVAFGMEHADYVTMKAPRPTLIICATRDFFPIDGVWDTFREAKRTYCILRQGDHLNLVEFNNKHAFEKPSREAALRWMRRWLMNLNDEPTEGEFAHFDEADFPKLWCTRTGQVLTDLKGKSVVDFIRERDEELAKGRAKAKPSKEEMLKEVRRLIAWQAPAAAKLTNKGKINREGYDIDKLAFETEPGISVPGLLFMPKELKKEAPLVLYLHGDGANGEGKWLPGKALDGKPGGPIEKLVKEGKRVLALDLRGMGETLSVLPPKDQPDYWGDFKQGFLALHLNRPLLGQRVYDLVAVMDKMADLSPQGFQVIAIGSAGPIALHAAALDQRIKQLTIDKSVLSWSLVARTPPTYNQLTNVIPGALKHYDLPDLAGLIAPRPLTIRAAADPVGKSVSQATLDAAYAVSRAAYAAQKADKQLTLEARE